MGRSRNRKKARKRSQQHLASPHKPRNNSGDFPISLPEFPPLPFNPQAPEGDVNELRKSLRVWIQEQVQALEELLLQYNSFDMIANLTLTQLGSNPETYKETAHEGLAAIIEYPTLLYLKYPFSQGTAQVIDGPILTQVSGRVRQIIQAILWYYASEQPTDTVDGERTPLDMFRYRTISQELIVRSPGYAHHQKERLQALFNPLADWFLANLGFTLADALNIDNAIEEITNHKLIARIREGQDGYRDITQSLQDSRSGRGVKEENRSLLSNYEKMSPGQARKIIKDQMMGWVFAFLGTTAFSFTAEEVALETNIPIDRVMAVLQYFCLEFDSINRDFFMLSPTHELKTKPFIVHDNNYLYPLPGTLIWAIQPRFEEVLNPSVPNPQNNSVQLWDRYTKVRADYLEKEAIRLLKHALNTTEAYHSLDYEVIQDGMRKQTELDGLVMFDATLFLVETKSGTLTSSARRGSKDRIKRDLKQLIGDAHSQALRAKDYIENSDNPTFLTKDGTHVVIDKERFRRTILIAVTLEPLDAYNAVLREVAKTGVLTERELPWAVSLDVLRVICEVNEFPSQLIHYLIRRLRVNELEDIDTHDELDWFGFYLEKGLYFEHAREEDEFIYLLSHSTPFDDYYFHEMGLRQTPTPKPSQPIPKLLHDIIMELESRHSSPGFSEAVIQLLDWSEQSRKQFVKLYERIRRLTRRDKGIHDFTLASNEGRSGVTCFSTTYQEAEIAFRRLSVYVQAKKYQLRADKWLGLLTIVNEKGIVHGFITGLSPWVPDPEMDEVVAQFFVSPEN